MMERKIGEIFEYKGEWYQCIRSITCNGCGFNEKGCTADKHLIGDCSGRLDGASVIFKKLEKVGIEIKQNEEDMEEKKLNLKPFDIQKAREGKTVCTRDGRKARIICFDRQHESNIVALITEENEEYICTYNSDGSFYKGSTDKNDLMMLPEKKEGWINIYRGTICLVTGGCLYDSEEEAKDAVKGDENYVTTTKVCWEE